MAKITLRKISEKDITHFKKWWRDADLIKLTSGDLTQIPDDEVIQYFSDLLNDQINYQYMIVADRKTIGHIALSKRDANWYELQIIIGEKNEWGKGYGTGTISEILKLSKQLSITNIYLEVRPTNARAIKSYEKCGFNSTGIIKYPNNPNLPETLRMEFLLI